MCIRDSISECTYSVTVADLNATILSCKKVIETIQPANPPAFPMPFGIVDTSQACVAISSSCPPNIYTLSFDSLDNSITTIMVDCDDAANPGGIVPGGYTVYLWAGNTLLDSCSNFLQVLDGAGHCVSPRAGSIAGNIYTEDDIYLPEVMVNLEGSERPGYMTDEEGLYAFNEIDFGRSYRVVPEKDHDYLNGVSTLDLVQIQRHVLGLETLNSPYKIIAADINRSGEVNGLDLVELRKLILGLYNELPDNTSWRMVDAAHEFFDPTNPFFESLPENYIVRELVTDMEIDFIGVKVGDVNLSAIVNGNRRVGRRSSAAVSLEVAEQFYSEGSMVDLPINLESLNKIEGYQYTLMIDNSVAEILSIQSDVKDFTEGNMNLGTIEEGIVNISWNTLSGLPKGDNTEMLSITVRMKADAYTSEFVHLDNLGLAPEAYINDVIHTLGFDYIEDAQIANVSLSQNSPNPWIETTQIEYYLPQAQSVSLQIYDVDGKLVYVHEEEGVQGSNIHTLSKDDFHAGGIYYYELQVGDDRLTQKMILMK